MKKSEKTHQGLYNVGFIGIENKEALRPRLNENGPTLLIRRPSIGIDSAR
jgi:hypothetical protein